MAPKQKKAIAKRKVLKVRVSEPTEDGDGGASSSAATPRGAGAGVRRLQRRSTEDQVDRAIETTFLKKVPKEVLEGRRNEKGQSIREVLEQELRNKRKNGGRLSSRFKAGLHTDFQLNQSAAELLPEADPPVEQEDMDKELLDRLGLIHHENPATRKTEPFLQYISVCGELTYAELVLTLRAIQEGPLVTRKSATKLAMAVLCYIARTPSAGNLFGSPVRSSVAMPTLMSGRADPPKLSFSATRPPLSCRGCLRQIS